MMWRYCFVGILLTGCATQTPNPVSVQPDTILTHKLQSVAVVLPPFQPVTRVPQDVSLQWSPPAEPDASLVTSYNLYVSTEPDLWEAAVIPVGNVTNAVVPGLVGGAQYYFAVTDLGPDGAESDYSPIISYIPNTVVDLMFAFDQPVTNVVLQASPDLVHWQDVGTIPTNGTWRITADTSLPMVIFRSTATTIP